MAGQGCSPTAAALRRILTSPQFLVRVEQEPAEVRAGQSYRITDLELASRLSFLLWSSTPDDALIEVAAKNQLHLPLVLEREVRRLKGALADKTLEVDFFKGALQKVAARRQRSDVSGGAASTTKSGK